MGGDWTLVLLNLWHNCNKSLGIYLCANHLNTPEGSCAVGEYANQGPVPKIRAHNIENISFSTLMVTGEFISSDCFLKDECLQCLSVHLTSGNIFLFP